MEAAACMVGRLGADGPLLGFAPSLDDRYDLVVAGSGRVSRAPAGSADLVSLAIAYFDDALGAPPEELAATHADIGALVRHVADREADPTRGALLRDAVDAIDDGLGGDAVIGALSRCLDSGADPLEALRRRATEVAGGT